MSQLILKTVIKDGILILRVVILLSLSLGYNNEFSFKDYEKLE